MARSNVEHRPFRRHCCSVPTAVTYVTALGGCTRVNVTLICAIM